MKKRIVLLLCLVLILGLAACTGRNSGKPAATSEPMPTPAAAETTPEPAEPTAEPAEETAEAAGESSDASEQAAGASGTNADEQPGSGTDAEYTEPAPLTDLETPTPVDDPLYEAAQSCVGRSVEELYEAVGEPTGGSQYAASCLEENAEDGMLYYDGFYVWTVKNDSGETVHAVYLSQ